MSDDGITCANRRIPNGGAYVEPRNPPSRRELPACARTVTKRRIPGRGEPGAHAIFNQNLMDRTETQNAAEVMAAFAQGKKIQFRARSNLGTQWRDADVLAWDWICFEYRIAPEAAPLDPGDIPPGTAIRHRGWPVGTWSQVVCVGEQEVRFATIGKLHEVSFRSLMAAGWEILAPGSSAWRPASKTEDAR